MAGLHLVEINGVQEFCQTVAGLCIRDGLQGGTKLDFGNANAMACQAGEAIGKILKLDRQMTGVKAHPDMTSQDGFGRLVVAVQP